MVAQTCLNVMLYVHCSFISTLPVLLQVTVGWGPCLLVKYTAGLYSSLLKICIGKVFLQLADM